MNHEHHDYAVIGVGALAEAIVTGLSEGQVPVPTIALSPRGRDRSARLSARYANVHVAASNQEAVSAAATVLLSVRPQDAEEVLGPLVFREDHRVVSVMARHSLDDLAGLVSPASVIVRAIPNPAVARRKGITPLHPGGSVADALFDGLGGAMIVDEERLLSAVSVASATVATHFAYLRTVSRWLADHGVRADVADRYIASIFAGTGSELEGVTDLEPLAASHATMGGLNERIEQTMRDAGVFDTVRGALDDLYSDLRADS